MIKAIVCDLDGSLMNPSSGLYVDDVVRDKLIEIQKKGIMVILNSARIFQGVYPLAKQIKMDEFGGFIISCNGANVYNVQSGNTLFEYTISHDDALKIWDYGLKHDVGVGYSQSDYFVANRSKIGFELDMHNCNIDYILACDPKKYLKTSICKCCISDDKEVLDQNFIQFRNDIEAMCDVKVVHSTDTMIDIINRDCEKIESVDRLLNILHIEWENVSAIGDGTSDAPVLEHAKYGVTLENGTNACKRVADKVVVSCYENGCLEWLEELLCE